MKEKVKAKAKMGRPSKRTPELIEEIITRLACGESLRKICKDEHMPVKENVLAWMWKDAEFRSQYMAAKEASAEAMLEEIMDIADESSQDMAVGPNGELRANSEVVQRSKLRVDTRKWAMARLAPKKYGLKVNAETQSAIKIINALSE